MTAGGSRFGADWLELREPVDHRSRSAELVRALASWLEPRRQPVIVDLGAGSGSNFRYLDARLRQPVAWRLFDHDAALLAAAADGPPRAAVTTHVCDLQAAALDGCIAGADVVTASALLDLASARWIDALGAACARRRAALLVALTIDGGAAFDRPDAADTAVWAAVARDQQRDKGLGPALGGAAPAALRRALARRRYRVLERASDWHLQRRDAALARALIEGWAEAAARQCPARAAEWAAWAAARSREVAAGAVRLSVGHRDVLGLPP